MTSTQFLTLAATALISLSIILPLASFVGVRMGNALLNYKHNVYLLISWSCTIFSMIVGLGIFYLVLTGVDLAKGYVDPVYLVVLGVVMCLIAYGLMRRKSKV